jgi:dipeptidyl aminopeptidase/acylaminoacyl peptidase
VERHDGEPDELPHRFLYFPDEGHWIQRPQNTAVWYSTILDFLDEHVLGK